MSAAPPLRAVVCGAGAFGRNHIRIYRELENSGYPVSLVALIEPAEERASALAAEMALPVFARVADCLAALPVDAASVCVPTLAHADVASQLLLAGVHVLVEKPIAATLPEADTLIRIAHDRQRILQVGHLERFNPAVAALATITNRPMFFEAHRLSVFSPRSLDVDVVLDLMIHDLDIVLHLAQSSVRDLHAVGLPILSSQVDIANVRLEFESGSVANFTASRVSTERVRKLRFFQPHQYISVDYARQDLLIIAVDAQGPGDGPAAAHAAPAMHFQKPPIVPGEPLRLEITAFLESIRHASTPLVSGVEARNALALALDIQTAIREHRRRAGLDTLLGSR